MRTRTFFAVWGLVFLLVFACSDDDGDNQPAGTTTGAVDTGEILGSVDDVRALVRRNATDLDPEMVEDVAFTDGRLTVTLAESQGGLDTSALADACRQIAEAIALPDLSVTVEMADGSQTADCGAGA